MSGGIHDVHAASEDRYRRAARVNRAAMCCGIDAVGQPADDHESTSGQIRAYGLREITRMRAAPAAAHDRDTGIFECLFAAFDP